LHRLVSHPQRDHRLIDAVSQQLHGGAVPQDVRAHLSASKRWARPRGSFAVATDQAFESIPAEMVATQRREQRRLVSHASFPDPHVKQLCGFPPQWRASLLATFSLASDV